MKFKEMIETLKTAVNERVEIRNSDNCPNCGADMRGKPNQLRDCENCIHHSDNGCEVWKCEFEKRSDL